MRNKKRSVPGIPMLVLKAIAALLVGLMLLELLVFTVNTVSEGDDGLSDVDFISWCEDDYYSRDYAELYDTLTLFDLYGEEYGLYWEVVDGYSTYLEYIQWSRAAQLGIENAEDRAAACYTALASMAEAPEFARNAAFLAEFLAAADAHQ